MLKHSKLFKRFKRFLDRRRKSQVAKLRQEVASLRLILNHTRDCEQMWRTRHENLKAVLHRIEHDSGDYLHHDRVGYTSEKNYLKKYLDADRRK